MIRRSLLVLAVSAVALGLAGPAFAGDASPLPPPGPSTPTTTSESLEDALPVAPSSDAVAPVAPGEAGAPARLPADAAAVDERLKDLPPPSIGLGELIGPLMKTMLMLGVVLVVVYLTLHKGLGKLVERQNLGKRVKVVERVALDPKRTLFVVEVDGQQMLLGAGEGGVVLLKDLQHPNDAPRAAAPDKASTGGLGSRFAEALRVRASKVPPVTTGLSRDLVAGSMSDAAGVGSAPRVPDTTGTPEISDLPEMKKA